MGLDRGELLDTSGSRQRRDIWNYGCPTEDICLIMEGVDRGEIVEIRGPGQRICASYWKV